ncbi:MAG: hypothetical protein COS82_09220 [Zetaproteobacteria bacterium CG06_land_8_20_14_3_00_59_53]|nr:MAG: hypothetical protein COV97_04490 [Zetaproteobacteria bacterium CG11_big_fil_rev_8_21_14_0_20_59_439]PIU69838.1 MAG: hypothetical protein COS82_09220 [Zetaproteobacteria bacterium CG06_land_8_20_14_3_00_59_53]PIY45664.1 MAG: hypothetical protein COZ02_08345 [Zetaproteobacteria bacterium CG_4_10_14_0_8_um_filter_59_127]PJC16830.1 MAG: hypothetical protein CO062_09320 [Zetaproteobacteria bacterium CG_4_9_14_0_2_um_filter_59_191]
MRLCVTLWWVRLIRKGNQIRETLHPFTQSAIQGLISIVHQPRQQGNDSPIIIFFIAPDVTPNLSSTTI